MNALRKVGRWIRRIFGKPDRDFASGAECVSEGVITEIALAGERWLSRLREIVRSYSCDWSVPEIAGLASAGGFLACLGLDELHPSKYLGAALAVVICEGPFVLAAIVEWWRSGRR